MKFTLICEDDPPVYLSSYSKFSKRKTTIEFESTSLEGVLENVEDFLEGCGFYFGEGYLDIVNEEKQPITHETDDLAFELNLAGAQPSYEYGVDSQDISIDLSSNMEMGNNEPVFHISV